MVVIMNAKNQTIKYKKLLKDLESWIGNKNWDIFFSKIEKKIKGLVNEKSEKSITSGLYQFTFIANKHAQHGLFDILKGEINGWSEIETAFEYRFWSTRTDSCMTSVMEASLLFIHALANNDSEKINWLKAYQLESLRKNTPNTWEFSSLGRFGLELYAELTDSKEEIVKELSVDHAPPSATYKGIFENWNNPENLKQAINVACNYHLEQAHRESGYPDFNITPYDLIPIEIIALVRIRMLKGLTTELPQHPLLDSPFYKMPPPIEAKTNVLAPEFIRLVEKAKELKLI